MSTVSILVDGATGELGRAAAEALRAAAVIGHAHLVLCACDEASPVPNGNFSIFPGSLQEALRQSGSDYVITLNCSEPDPADRIVALWNERHRADILIASLSSLDRGTRPKDLPSELDRLADRLIARLLTLEVLDLRSMTRLYRRAVVDDLATTGCDFDDTIGLLVNATVRGWKIREVERPFWPQHRTYPATHRPSLRALGSYWVQRNGIHDADYDMRAFNSRIPAQRRWQQRRHELTMDLVRPYLGRETLNVGCGSARMNLDLGGVGVDVVLPKLRYLSRFGVNRLALASVYNLPFHDESFGCVICTEVLEHIPREGEPVGELVRVLRPDGRLVISTPDYGSWRWPAIERLYQTLQPRGYADEHVTHYTESTLTAELEAYGLRCVEMRKMFDAILIGAFERRGT
jgi:SAM-dependent methyltransferase